MDRLAAAILIAAAVLAMNGGMLRDVIADECRSVRSPRRSRKSLSAGPGRSERVLSLLLTLEALRAAPALLDTPESLTPPPFWL